MYSCFFMSEDYFGGSSGIISCKHKAMWLGCGNKTNRQAAKEEEYKETGVQPPAKGGGKSGAKGQGFLVEFGSLEYFLFGCVVLSAFECYINRRTFTFGLIPRFTLQQILVPV